MSRASSIHESERQHGSLGELQSFDKINPFKRIRAARTASTSSATLEGGFRNGNDADLPNVTPAYIPASFDTSQPLRRTGSQPAVAGPFGSASPPEDELGFPPARSEEEALARHTYHPNASASGSGPGRPERQRSRGMSLVGAAANIAVAGFGMGESDQEMVGRTLSRVSTHKSYREAQQQSYRIAEPGRMYRTGEENEEEQSRSSVSERTRVESDATAVEKRPEPSTKPGHADAGADPEKATPPPPLPLTDVEKRTAETEDEIYMVRFDPGEAANPKNWTVRYRWYITGASSLLVLNSTFASSAPSGIVREMTEYFGFGQEVATLTVSLFVAG